MPASLVLAALLQVADAAPAPRYSSADDCAIMVLAGKEKLGWGTQKPKYAFSATRFNKDGTLSYGVNCVWEDFGIVSPEGPHNATSSSLSRIQPRPSPGLPGWLSDITPPVYDAAGVHAAATVILTNFNSGRPAVQRWTCDFFRYGDQWNLSGCKELPLVKLN